MRTINIIGSEGKGSRKGRADLTICRGKAPLYSSFRRWVEQHALFQFPLASEGLDRWNMSRTPTKKVN